LRCSRREASEKQKRIPKIKDKRQSERFKQGAGELRFDKTRMRLIAP
jgi:hypothetical protein